MKYFNLWMMVAVGLVSSGCSLAPESDGSGADDGPAFDDDVGTAESAIVESNALSLNALSLNALSLNALSLNALSLNALAGSTLSALQDPGSNGDLARQFVRYAASCALGTSQSFQYSWTDAASVVHNETNWGALGLSPGWASGPLSAFEEQLVSACLFARVNWYGVRVVISLRGPVEALAATAEEKATYSIVEGAFWGNVFGPSPAAFSCYSAPNVDASRVRLRDCAAGHLDPTQGALPCGMIAIVGSCEARCDPLSTSSTYYAGCAAAGSSYAGPIITTWLQE